MSASNILLRPYPGFYVRELSRGQPLLLEPTCQSHQMAIRERIPNDRANPDEWCRAIATPVDRVVPAQWLKLIKSRR